VAADSDPAVVVVAVVVVDVGAEDEVDDEVEQS
jgi:hypothetical protein